MGLGVWAIGLALALGLPGSTWKQALPPLFPWEMLGPTILALTAPGRSAGNQVAPSAEVNNSGAYIAVPSPGTPTHAGNTGPNPSVASASGFALGVARWTPG